MVAELPALESGTPRSEIPSWRGARYPTRLRVPGHNLLPYLHYCIEVQIGLSNRNRPVLADLADDPDDPDGDKPVDDDGFPFSDGK